MPFTSVSICRFILSTWILNAGSAPQSYFRIVAQMAISYGPSRPLWDWRDEQTAGRPSSDGLSIPPFTVLQSSSTILTFRLVSSLGRIKHPTRNVLARVRFTLNKIAACMRSSLLRNLDPPLFGRNSSAALSATQLRFRTHLSKGLFLLKMTFSGQ
jgi:hypothetical protein